MPALEKQPIPPQKMTFDDFIAWYETQEGRWELHDGVPVRRHDPAKGQSERFGHLRAKHAIVKALEAAIEKAGLTCEAVPDGVTVQISDYKSYEPDALVYCGQRIGDDKLVAPTPLIIAEVLSPSTAWKDVSDKLHDYFTLESVQHYLILDPSHKTIQHHYRDGETIAVQAVTTECLQIDPPEIKLFVGNIFG